MKKQGKRLTELARRIKAARLDAHISQNTLGKSVGVSDKSVSAYEQGRSAPPFAKLKKIAAATNHPISFFTEDNIEEVILAKKLMTIERELTEVKRLLTKAQK